MSLYSYAVRNPLLAVLSNHIDGYPSPINLSYLWGFGSIAGMALVTQIVTGVLLAMHYTPEIHLAFSSVEHIMRDVRGGTALRYIHANGASMFFIVVYIHMFRGLYYGSYFQPRANLWYSGIIIFFLMMATGFMGYVLPWGQMSFWGATVITNLFSAIPGIGNSIVQLLWGGFSVDNPTLNRFFSLHYLLPFLIVGVVLLHLVLLHQNGSNNPLGISSVFDRIPFYPYFYVKDLFGFLLFVLFFSFFVIYAPNYLGHPDNYIEANPLVTPAHIVPEWYFLPFYAILRTIPDKLGGVVLMGVAIVIIALLPVVDTSAFRSSFFKPLNIWLFWYFFADSVSLGWIGQEIVESPFIEMANFVTLSYFLYFLPVLPFLGFLENASISWGVRNYNETTSKSNHSYNYSFIGLGAISPSFFENIDFSQDWVTNFVSGVQLFQFLIITLALLLVTSYLPRKVEALAFLHRLGFGYFSLNFLLSTVDRPIRQEINYNSNFVLNDILETFTFLQGDSALFHLFFVFITLILVAFFYGTIDRCLLQNGEELEFPIILIFIASSALIIFYVHTLIEFLLALETLTLASYVSAGYERQNRHSSYASVQYFILGAIPSGMLILGIGLLYSQTGVMSFEDLDLFSSSVFESNNFAGYLSLINDELSVSTNTKNITHVLYNVNSEASLNELSTNLILVQNNVSEIINDSIISSTRTPAILVALLFILFNLWFKLTAAPFHFWAPSVYKYAPIATVTYISILSKAMVIFLLFKFSLVLFQPFSILFTPLFLLVAVLTVFIGLLGALAERFVKPFFVYSSMGHVGFMLAGLSLFTLTGFSAAFHYLGIYIISSFLMWFILLYAGKDTRYLISFKSLKKADPIVALIFAFLIFSMSGIPPFGGFFIKLDVLAALLENSRYGVNIILFFFTVAMFFYYLKINKILFFDQTKEFIKHYEINSSRLQLFVLLFIFLLFYMFLVQPSLYEIGRDFFIDSL